MLVGNYFINEKVIDLDHRILRIIQNLHLHYITYPPVSPNPSKAALFEQPLGFPQFIVAVWLLASYHVKKILTSKVEIANIICKIAIRRHGKFAPCIEKKLECGNHAQKVRNCQ